MPKRRLLVAGLLSDYPLRSPVFQKMLNREGTRHRWTDAQKMHVTALYWTPGLSNRWVTYQLERFGCSSPEHRFTKLRKLAAKPENRSRWEHLGQENLLYITKREVFNYYKYHPPGILWHPSWALLIFQDYRKQGKSVSEIARMHGIDDGVLRDTLKRRSLFKPHARNPNPIISPFNKPRS